MFLQDKNKKYLFPGILFLMLFFSFTVQAHASWTTNEDGTYSYQLDDGSVASDQWVDKNYYVDANGIRVTGKQLIESEWYYFSKEDGMLLKDQWIKDEEGKYYASEDGSLYANGIYKIDKYKYLFGADGSMQVGECTFKKKTYYLNPKNGRMMKSLWIKIGKQYYYFSESGAMLKNKWLLNYTYYVGSKGARLKKTWKNGRYLGSDGKAFTGFRKIDGERYYFDPKTHKKITNTLVTIKGKRWYFDSDGIGAINNVPKPHAGVDVQPEYYSHPVVDDETLLSYIIYCEAGNQVYAGKLGVGYVIMNRLYSKQFAAATIREVIYQRKQFNPTWDGAMARVYKKPSLVTAECKKAAKTVLRNRAAIAAGKTVKVKVDGKKISFPYLFFMRLESYRRLGLSTAYKKIQDHVFFVRWS